MMPMDQPAKPLRRLFAEVLGSMLFVSVLTIAFYQYYRYSDAKRYGRIRSALAASVVGPAGRSSAVAYISPPPGPAPAPEAEAGPVAVPLPRQIRPPLRPFYQESDPVEPDAGAGDKYAPDDH